MRSWLANLRSLVLPFDAGPGDARVVIDGELGTITGYDNTGDVVFHIQATGGPAQGIWSTDGAASTDVADLTGVGYVHLDREDIMLSEQHDLPADIRASNIGGLVLEGALHNSGGGDQSRITLDTDQFRIRAGPNTDPVITVSDTTDGFGTLTFAHGANTTPRLILPIGFSPTTLNVNVIDTYGATTAHAITNLASTAITFRALVIT